MVTELKKGILGLFGYYLERMNAARKMMYIQYDAREDQKSIQVLRSNLGSPEKC